MNGNNIDWETDVENVLEELCGSIVRKFNDQDGDIDPYDIVSEIRGLKPWIDGLLLSTTHQCSQELKEWAESKKKPTEKSEDGSYEDFKTSTGSRDTLLQFAYNTALDDLIKKLEEK